MEKTSLYAYIQFTGKDDMDDFPVEVVSDNNDRWFYTGFGNLP